VTQLNSTRRRVELRRQSVYSDANATQLNSTSSCRHVHSVNNCHRSVMNVVTQLTQFIGHDVIYDVFWRVYREMEFWSEELEEKLIELWKKTCLFIRHMDQSLQRPCKKAEALENISQEMDVAGRYITHHNAALGTKTRLTCFALIGCTLFNWVSCIADRRRQLCCVDEGVYSDATQLHSTSSWVASL